MRVVFRVFSVFPLWVLHALGGAMGWLVFWASPTYRRRFLANSALAGYAFEDVRAAVGHAGRMVAELPRLWLGAPMPCRLVGEGVVEEAYAARRGVLFLTPHQGCFELAAQVGARYWGPRFGPITVLYRPARQAWLAKVMETARNRPGMLAVPTNLSGVRQMIKALRRGEAVGLLPDQVPPEGQGLWSPFFGRDAYTMTLAVRLAQQTGAAVVLARCDRLSWGRGFAIYFESLAQPLSRELDAAVTQINQAMEHLIRQRPDQYLWGYARYKQPRNEAMPAPAPAAEGRA
jgi:KDO2-lipid IV(A) lauroyltransferase